ncbi:MAG TPA: hypothetical protein VEJ46_05095 [Candidatus Acidoferrum sp.]|nr:hypothetical protein [Candidatus Acidoferrum sp.]
MQLLDGLYPYEVVLLLMGLALFAVLLVLLVFTILKNRPYGSLLWFFVLPIGMVGYSGIQSFSVTKDGLDIQKYSDELQQNPADQSARTALSSAIANVAARPWSNPTTLTNIARAQLMVGDKEGAQKNLALALQKNPQLEAAQSLSVRIETEKQVAALTKQVEQNPSDEGAKATLRQNVANLSKTGVANPATIASIAQAQAALGNRTEALKNADLALKIDPKQTAAIELKNHLQVAPVETSR